MIWRFYKKKQKAKEQEIEKTKPIRVVVVCPPQFSAIQKEVIQKALSANVLFDVCFETESWSENFLNLDNKNFFDFLDSGLKMLKIHHADVLMRLYLHKNGVRINFQTSTQYVKYQPLWTSLLNSLYLPLSYFESQNLPLEMSFLIQSILMAINAHKHPMYQECLEHLIDILSKNKMPAGMDAKFLPYMFNFLALVYIGAHRNGFQKNDVSLIQKLLHLAFKNLSLAQDQILEGGLYATLGQMYEAALSGAKADSYLLLQRALESYKKAQKYFNRYVFVYDYGRLSVVISKLYRKIFALTDDNQALRDCIAHLREAEKIFTFASNPIAFDEIKSDLAKSLAVLSTKSNSEEIALMAVSSYKDLQTLYTKENMPYPFALLEAQIADIYYHLGKHTASRKHLDAALKYYDSALDVFENLKMKNKVQELETYMLKAAEEIMRIN